MATNNDKAYKAALKQVDDMLKKQEALKKSTDSLASSWNAISSEIFKMDGAKFFKDVEKSEEELNKIAKDVEELEGKYKLMGNEFESMINKSIGGVNGLQKQLTDMGSEYQNNSKAIQAAQSRSFELQRQLSDELKNRIKLEGSIESVLQDRATLTEAEIKDLEKIQKLNEDTKKFQLENEKYNESIQEKLDDLIKSKSQIGLIDKKISTEMLKQISQGKTISDLMKNSTPEGMKFLALLSDDTKETKNIANGMQIVTEQIKLAQEESKKMNKQFEVGTLGLKFLGNMASGLGSIIKKDWVSSMTKFDEVLNDVQKQTGVNMDFNKTKFAELQTEVAQFGMSVEGAGKMIADMSSELRTTNFSVLSQATKDFASIEGATGAAAGDITTIAGELMRMGESSGQVKDFMQDADTMARKFGVSSAKAMSAIARNIGKIRQMGFVGGEKSLGKMVATAERLRMNVDEIFDVAKRARNIEGALDMAAELQLAGGSFANINPMDLLAAARKGPAELQKILTSMGKDIGHFSQETGKYEFDAVDVDRLQMVADATGQSLDSIQNMIQKNAEDTDKLNPFQGMMDGLEEADQEIAKSALSDMITRNKDGSLSINADSDMAKKMGVDSLEDINSDTIQAMLKQKMEDASTLEEQNKRNQSLKQSFDNFINSLMSIFSFFQPALEFLTKIMQEVTSVFTSIMSFLPGWSKALLGGLLVFGAMFSTSVGAFITQGIGGFIKGVGSFAKSSMDLIKQVMTGKGGEALGGLGSKIKDKFMGGGKKDLAESGLKTGGDVAGQKGMTPQAGSGIKGFFTGLSEGIQSFGKVDMGAIAKFALSLLVVGGAIIGFGYAMATIGGEAGIGQMVTAAVSLGMLMLAIWGMSMISKSVDMGGVLKGALALFVVGAALVPFAFAAQMLTGVDLMSVLGALGILALVVVALIGLGALLMTPIVGWLLMAGIAALVAIGAGLLLAGTGMLAAATAMEKLGGINWAGFSEMGSALGSVVPGMLAFSLAAMMFMNPLTLLGIIFMVGALTSLAAVMGPLSESLTMGADSLDRFASGLEKLSAAADKLSLEKLEKLKELSDSMANAGAGGAAMAAIANTANNAGGGAGGDGEVRKIEVNVKMNGRDMQNFIVKDTAIIK